MTYEQRELNRLVHNVPDKFREIEKITDDIRPLCDKLYQFDNTLTFEDRHELASAISMMWAVAVVTRENLEEVGVGDKKKKIFMIDHLKFWK